MEPKEYISCRLVKGEDLNHHGTLFAGRSASWFVEAGFIAAAGATRPENVVCAKIHGMSFTKPARSGHIVVYVGKIIDVGTSRLIAHVKVLEEGSTQPIVEGFLTFVHVDMEGRPTPHGISEITTVTEEDRLLKERARLL
jgi:acyl-CoA hydrolase